MDNAKEQTKVRRVGEPNEMNKVYLEEQSEGGIDNTCETMMGEFQIFGLMGREYRLGTQRLFLVKKILEGPGRAQRAAQMAPEVLEGMETAGRDLYPSLNLVGWGVNQPGYGTEEVWRFLAVQEKYFSGCPVFLLMDGEKGRKTFYLWQEGQFQNPGGYFVYKESEAVPMQQAAWDDEEEAKDLWAEPRAIESESSTTEGGGEAVDRETTQSMRVLTSLASVLLLICLVMGMLLFNHVNTLEGIQQKINAMTQQIEQIYTGVFGGEQGEVE